MYKSSRTVDYVDRWILMKCNMTYYCLCGGGALGRNYNRVTGSSPNILTQESQDDISRIYFGTYTIFAI